MTGRDLQAFTRTFFDAITGLRVRPRFCRAEGPSGLHRSPQRGETVEFSEYRAYTPGVELRFLDWKLFARTDRLYVKSFCDERASRFLIAVDDSPSMRWPADGPTKMDLACKLAMGIAYLAAHRQKDAVNVMPLFSPPALRDECRTLGAILARLQGLLSAPLASDRPGDISISDALSRLDLRTPTTVIVISDFYENPEQLLGVSRRARKSGHEFWFLHVLSKDEVALPFENLADFIDMETGRRLQLDPRVIRGRYSQALHDHIAALKELGAHGRFAMGILGHDPAEILKRFLHD